MTSSIACEVASNTHNRIQTLIIYPLTVVGGAESSSVTASLASATRLCSQVDCRLGNNWLKFACVDRTLSNCRLVHQHGSKCVNPANPYA
jgi:hypothetical protein